MDSVSLTSFSDELLKIAKNKSSFTKAVLELEKKGWKPVMKAQPASRVMKVSRQPRAMKPQKYKREFEAGKQ